MDEKFSVAYEVDLRGGRPSIAPEKLMRAMLLKVLFSIRSKRQLVEQIDYHLLFPESTTSRRLDALIGGHGPMRAGERSATGWYFNGLLASGSRHRVSSNDLLHQFQYLPER